ncbi:MAG: AAA family ATPase [Candidatus Omnitrophota bacterium]
MPVKKIKEIKNIDAFDLFNWVGDDLKKYNLVYGWNRSGKTTLSRLFNFLERKQIHISDLLPIDFNIQTETGSIKKQDISTHTLNIRVFNEDFIKENLLFDESKAKKIIILGKENVATQKEIADFETKRRAKQVELDQLEGQRLKMPKLDSIFTDAGRAVPRQFSNTPLANDEYYGRTYDKRKVENQINNGTVSEANFLSLIIPDQADIDSKREIIKSEKKRIEINISKMPDFSGLLASANDLLATTVAVQEIEELKDDVDLRNWVENGYYLHKNRNLNSCKFCEGPLPNDLLIRLSSFFTDELKKAKQQIGEIILKLSGNDYKKQDFGIEPNILFSEFVKDYIATKNETDKQGKIVSAALTKIIKDLEDKKNHLHNHTKKYARVEYPEEAVDKINTGLAKVEYLVSQHNNRVDTIAEGIKQAAKEIELHIIASTLSNKEYFEKKRQIEEFDQEISTIKKELLTISAELKVKTASLHNTSEAVQKINMMLKEFFGESQIYLEVTEPVNGEVGYILKRRGKDAKHLSEGEESVLALVYFLIKLEEDGCDKQNCLIVIDDPVDSQDNIFLFRTAGLVKRQLKDIGQLIIFTHNFEFFNLMRDWFLGRNLANDSQMYLISCDKENVAQKVKVENLPELLKKYKSEYQYLFCRLYQFANDIRSLDEPLVANIARKVLEYFAGFKWSCRTTEDFTSIVHNRFIANPNDLKKGTGDFVVKFLHEYSHGQDFSRAISASMLEGKSIAQNVLKFIELADSEHYNDLKTLCAPTAS